METGNGGGTKTTLVVGPRLLTFAQAVGDRELRYVPIPVEDYTSVLAEFLSFLAYLFIEVLDGRNANLPDGALGRGPKDFSGYARDAAATGVWNG